METTAHFLFGRFQYADKSAINVTHSIRQTAITNASETVLKASLDLSNALVIGPSNAITFQINESFKKSIGEVGDGADTETHLLFKDTNSLVGVGESSQSNCYLVLSGGRIVSFVSKSRMKIKTLN